MGGGLVTTTEHADAGATSGGQVQTDLTGDATPTYTTMTGSQASHLDSFIANSGWTREDLVVVLSLAQTLILLYWLKAEVA